MNQLILPDTYTPFTTVCSGANRFHNAHALVTIDGIAPLLIGSGTVPRVWLFAPGDQIGAAWLPCVRDNICIWPHIVLSAHSRLVKVQLDSATLLNATIGADDALVLHHLDLRPLGINIYMDGTCTHLMGNLLVSGTWHSAPVIVAVSSSR